MARDDLVVDVGAGTAVLTRALLDAGARVVAVERDAALAAGLRARFGGDISVVEADVLDWPLPGGPFAVVANLPFAGSGAILSRLLRGPVTSADVIVEWGFAQKHVAVWPSTLKGTYWRTYYDVAIVRHLDRSAFSPTPAVDAAVVRFTRLPNRSSGPASRISTGGSSLTHSVRRARSGERSGLSRRIGSPRSSASR